MAFKLTENDLILLSNLRKNARVTLTSLSKETRVPVSTLFDRLQNIKKHIIKKFTTIINFQYLGYTTKATITLKVSKDDKQNFLDFIIKNKFINSAYRINNGFDFIIEVLCKDMKELENFIDDIESKFAIKSKQIFYVLEDIKREEFLADLEYLKIIKFKI